MDVSLETVQGRDPKGLYAKAAAGLLKGMTGMSSDAPYEPPLAPEVNLPNDKLSIDDSVAILMKALKDAGFGAKELKDAGFDAKELKDVGKQLHRSQAQKQQAYEQARDIAKKLAAAQAQAH